MKKLQPYIPFALALAAGAVYRFFLASYAQSGIYWDMQRYHELALKVLSGGFAVDCCQKVPGYGMFLAAVYAVSGSTAIQPVRMVQACLDLVSAVLVFFILRKLGASKVGKWGGFLLYLINPFTASYTGLRLSEVLTATLVVLLAGVYAAEPFRKKPLYWFGSGLLLGLMFLTRLQFLYVSVFMLLLFAIFIPKHHRLSYVAVAASGFMIVALYAVIGYWRVFGVISVSPPYSNFYHDLYSNYYQTVRYHEITNRVNQSNPEYDRLTLEYFSVPLEGKSAYDAKYRVLFLNKLRTDWQTYATNWLRNMVWLWDRYFLFDYTDPFYPTDVLPVRALNVSMMVLAVYGLVNTIRKKGRHLSGLPFVVYSIVLFLYPTLLFSLVSNETRHTVFFIPIVCVWAGMGIGYLETYRKRRTERKALS